MLTLSRARKIPSNAGQPIPTVFRGLANQGVHITRGQVTLIAGAPGGGKSVFSMVAALRCGAPSLYLSADTSRETMIRRAAAHLMKVTTDEVKHAELQGHTAAIEAHFAKLGHVRFDFAKRIDCNDSTNARGERIPAPLTEQLMAYAMTYGEYPHLIVADNIKNVDAGDSDDELSRYMDAMAYLDELARWTSAAVVALHHVTGKYNNGTTPVPLDGIKGQISADPAVVLTLHRQLPPDGGAGRMFVCPVKNRDGQADGEAGWQIPLRYEPARMQLSDMD